MEELLLESFGFSDIGSVREKNEDAWLKLPQTSFFALADGMGGHRAGEVASRKAIESLAIFVNEHIPPRTSAKQAISLLKEGIQKTNRKVYELSQTKSYFHGMGTTLCLLYLFQGYAIYAHVGDSRIYRYRNKELKQLTQDHIAKKSRKNALSRAIGINQEVFPEIACASVQEGDLFFLCSDGLSNFLDPKEIEKILGDYFSLKKMAKKLIYQAQEKGSNDNITTLLVRIKHGKKNLYLPGQ